MPKAIRTTYTQASFLLFMIMLGGLLLTACGSSGEQSADSTSEGKEIASNEAEEATEDQSGSIFSLSPKGPLLYTDHGNVYLLDITNPVPQKLTQVEGNRGIWYKLSVSPDRKYIAMTWSSRAAQGDGLCIVNTDTLEQTCLRDLKDTDYYSVSQSSWSSDGKQVAFSTAEKADNGINDSVYILSVDEWYLHQLHGITSTNGTQGLCTPVWSPSEPKIAYGLGGALYTADSESFEIRAIIEGGCPAWSPDGANLVYVIRVNDNLDIYLSDSNGSETTRLTTDQAPDITPLWSHDGTQIIFSSARNGHHQYHIMNKDGSDVKPLLDVEWDVNHFTLSPDGKYAAFTNNAGAFFRADTSASNPNLLELYNEFHVDSFAWSPDGNHIAFSTQQRIYIMEADGENLTALELEEIPLSKSVYWMGER